MTSDQVVRSWHAAARSLTEPGIEVWDAHTHTGQNDPDGLTNTAAATLDALDQAEQRGAVIIASADPGGYDAANRRILEEAAGSDGRLIPFARSDPRRPDAARILGRELDSGHRGVKLHPRAEAFALTDDGVIDVARVAAERRAPILIHAGRGMPSLADGALRLVEQLDGLRLILAHCAISDLSRLGPKAGDHPGLYFDTSWWNISDRLALAAWVAPGRILYASDTPYGAPLTGFTLAMRTAAAAGYTVDQCRAFFGGTLHRLLNGDDGEDLGGPPGEDFMGIDLGLLRVYAGLQAALGAAFSGGDASEAISLARSGCEVADGTRHEQVYRAIAVTLDAIDSANVRTRFALLVVAAAAALTPQVPVAELE